MAQGVAFADHPVIDRFECGTTEATGDRVTVDSGSGAVRIE